MLGKQYIGVALSVAHDPKSPRIAVHSKSPRERPRKPDVLALPKSDIPRRHNHSTSVREDGWSLENPLHSPASAHPSAL
jgi:hypothetical protein